MEKQVPNGIGKQLDAIEFTPNAHLLLAASNLSYRYWTGTLCYFSKAELAPDVGECNAGVDVESGAKDLKLVKGTDRFVIGTDSGSVELWEASDSEQFKVLKPVAQPIEHDGMITSVSINSKSSRVASASQDCTIKIWDLEEFVSVNAFRAHTDIVSGVAFHPEQDSIFTSTSQDGNVILWDLRNPKPAIKIKSGLPSMPTCLAWQPSIENGVVIGTESGHMKLLDLRNLDASVDIIQPHTRLISRIVFNPENAAWFASISEDCSVVVTEYTAGSVTPIYRDDSHSDFVQGVAWHPDGRLFTCGWDFKIINRRVVPNLEKEVDIITEKLREKVETMDTASTETPGDSELQS